MDDSSGIKRRFRKLLGFVTGERSPLPAPTETPGGPTPSAGETAAAIASGIEAPLEPVPSAIGQQERPSQSPPPAPAPPHSPMIFAAPAPTAERDDDLEQVLNENRIRSVFQPIINLADGSVFGYEALSRGPIGTRLEGADALFGAAAAVGATHRLERVCRFRSIAAAAGIPSGCYLFLNLSPRVLEEQNAGLSREVIEQSRLAQERVVLEITEKQAIADFDLLKRALLYYYRQGFKVAIDDAGAGHNSLRAVTEVRPHFIKLDMALVRDIDRDRAKNALVSAIIIFAKRIDAKVLAEGIETVDELATLIEIGVDLGQGFLLGRPSSGFIEPKPEIAAFIRERSSTLRAVPMPKRMAVSTITRRAPALMPTAYTSELLEIFDRNADLDSVVLTEFGAPVGLVSRTKLYERLSQQFGYSLYSKRAVRLVMDDSYLAVDAKDSIEEVARKVTHRRSTEMYDEIVVLEDGVYAGVVSVRDLLHTMTEFQATMARNTNPLTGLPGRIPLQQEIDRRCESNTPFAVLHIDLLNFRAYNERFGIERGDEVIALLAETLSTVVAESNDRQATVGHLGGVNFLAVCDPANVERLGRAIIEAFGRRAAPLHVARDLASVEHGNAVPPSIGLALVGITATSPPLPNLASLQGRTARYKRVARAAGGNAFVLDGQLIAGRVVSFPQEVG
ncbi:MAG TPA: GGDEF domain-containing protein [Candidatus Eremiobacteraceae bacterium]|nr:GGDEF domain-containing protein [Candidatus Eremiobacteraceae bacterium]